MISWFLHLFENKCVFQLTVGWEGGSEWKLEEICEELEVIMIMIIIKYDSSGHQCEMHTCRDSSCFLVAHKLLTCLRCLLSVQ